MVARRNHVWIYVTALGFRRHVDRVEGNLCEAGNVFERRSWIPDDAFIRNDGQPLSKAFMGVSEFQSRTVE